MNILDGKESVFDFITVWNVRNVEPWNLNELTWNANEKKEEKIRNGRFEDEENEGKNNTYT